MPLHTIFMTNSIETKTNIEAFSCVCAYFSVYLYLLQGLNGSLHCLH